jgi:uncharacterized repeat protein (TIGR04052 family)
MLGLRLASRVLVMPALVLVALWSLAACGDDGTSSSGTSSGGAGSGGAGEGGAVGQGGASTQAVEITFRADVAGAPFACGTTYDGLGSALSSAEIADLRMYVHDVRLTSGASSVVVTLDQDGVWQHENLALLDFEDKTGACANGTAVTNLTIRGTIPAGTTYDGVSFRLGVPFDLNHGDASTAPSPLNLSALFWNWQGGHKFLRADVFADGASGPFNIHLGSTGCDGDAATGGVTSCSRPNVAEIALSGFDAATNVVVLDAATLLGGVDVSADAGGAPGCMSGVSDPECAPIFASLGVDIATGLPAAAPQLAFSVE